MNPPQAPAPLAGVRVVEFSQMVMGPSCGLILADLGAEVIKIEPLPGGDRSRYLPGIASGFFVTFNRNKKSLAVNMKSPRGLALIRDLPFAPVRAPGELVDDLHLNASNGLIDIGVPDGHTVRIPAIPVAFGGKRLGKRNDPPSVGSDSREILTGIGLSAGEIDTLFKEGLVAAEDVPARVRDSDDPQEVA